MPKRRTEFWNVIDLFSGAGGMSLGFHRHGGFRITGAVDAQIGKPSSRPGTLECNGTYFKNIGIKPVVLDLGLSQPNEVLQRLAHGQIPNLSVLLCCPPCTGFTRTNSQNHLKDDPRNNLVRRTALFVAEFNPKIVIMENARELLTGNFRHHFLSLQEQLMKLNYQISAKTYFLNRFGLPQIRERAIVIAAKEPVELRDLDALWEGHSIKSEATTVRRAIGHLARICKTENHNADDPAHVAPRLTEEILNRIRHIPKDGGSWADLTKHPAAEKYLTNGMRKLIAKQDWGSFPDVYGRMAWDRPAPTIKRECAHVGNGRYAHPEEDRLCSLREMSILQGFPDDFVVNGAALSNLYRHVGDAVPPLISYQLAHVCAWILTGRKPRIANVLLRHTHLTPSDIVAHHD